MVLISNRKYKKKSGLLLVLVMVFATASVNASVKYVFSVTEQPAMDFHKPFVAELVLSDAAVSAGQAVDTDIESLLITGGTTVRSENPLRLTHMHADFINWTVTLSDDRQVVTAISAVVTPHMSSVENWVLYQPGPPHPELQVHENLGYVGADYVRLETTLLPVPPTTHSSTFKGEWKREFDCWFCRIFEQWVACFPFCIWPWLIILLAIILPVMVWRIRNSKNRI